MTTSKLRGTLRAFAFLVWTVLLVPPYLILFVLGRWIRRPFVSLWHKGVVALIGMKVNTHGSPCKSQRVLLVGNHISYLDIPVLASCFDVTFVAKADVAGWPVFGFLARIAQTAFIERKPSKARQQAQELQQRLLDGERLMIFPEGTSSSGKNVLPFKSALFEIVMKDHVKSTCYVQPVTISFSHDKKGRALSDTERDNFAWYGDMTLAPHLWNVFCGNGGSVDVIFHEPVLAGDFVERKLLAAWAQARVQAGLSYLDENPTLEKDGTSVANVEKLETV